MSVGTAQLVFSWQTQYNLKITLKSHGMTTLPSFACLKELMVSRVTSQRQIQGQIYLLGGMQGEVGGGVLRSIVVTVSLMLEWL